MWVVARSSITQSDQAKGRPGPVSSSMRLASSRASAARQMVASPAARRSPKGLGSSPSSAVGKRSSQRSLLRSVTRSSTHGSVRGGVSRAPGRSTSASKSSPHTLSKVRSTASSTSPRLRKFTVMRSARPSALASARWRRKTLTSAWRKP